MSVYAKANEESALGDDPKALTALARHGSLSNRGQRAVIKPVDDDRL
jgi:hypothetical protein